MKPTANHTSNLFDTYQRLPLKIESGKGVWLIDSEGKKYLDFFGGLAVNALGYGDPDILKAINLQAEKYIHLSNYFSQDPQERLAKLLSETTDYGKIFFSNSGTESVEGAVKIARKWGANLGKRKIISFSGSFHGRTLGALSLMDRAKYKEGFGPFLPDCEIIPFNDPARLEAAIGGDTAAVFLEFLQGESGVIPASKTFVETLSKLREKHRFLIVADEIQSGMGRTGKFFCFEHYGIRPDIALLAKALGGGLPLGAILATSEVARVITPGSHGSTFGGNPVACAAGMAVLQKITGRKMIGHVNSTGGTLRKNLEAMRQEFPETIKEVRGLGLMIGIELFTDCSRIVDALRENGVLVNRTNSGVIRLLPPLVIAEEHINEFMKKFRASLFTS